MKKIMQNQEGFTLTEILIGMMILTVAIVTSTSILVGLIDTNKNVVQTQQAYYLAQEGVEAVRNIRDTNWINNVNFLGDSRVLGVLEEGREYSLGLKSMAWKNSVKDSVDDIARYRSWDFFIANDQNDRLCRYEEDGRSYFGICTLISGDDLGFRRRVSVEKYCEDIFDELCEDSFLVKSVVSWDDREVELSAVLTNWKGGAL